MARTTASSVAFSLTHLTASRKLSDSQIRSSTPLPFLPQTAARPFRISSSLAPAVRMGSVHVGSAAALNDASHSTTLVRRRRCSALSIQSPLARSPGPTIWVEMRVRATASIIVGMSSRQMRRFLENDPPICSWQIAPRMNWRWHKRRPTLLRCRRYRADAEA